MNTKARLLIAALLPLLLSGCWFVFIPGSVTSAISDSITGDKGEHCVSRGAAPGDTVRMPGGGQARVLSLSGESIRCSQPEHPIRAELAF